MQFGDIHNTQVPRAEAPSNPGKHKCADCGTPLRTNAKYRCRRCFLLLETRPGIGRFGPRPHEPKPQGDHDRYEQNKQFCLAMMRAFYRKLERPPGLKISKKPGTQHPVFVDPGIPNIQSASSSWWMVESGGGMGGF